VSVKTKAEKYRSSSDSTFATDETNLKHTCNAYNDNTDKDKKKIAKKDMKQKRARGCTCLEM